MPTMKRNAVRGSFESDPFTTVADWRTTRDAKAHRYPQSDYRHEAITMAESNSSRDGHLQPSPTGLLRSGEVQPVSINDYIRSLLRCLLLVQCDPEDLLDETDRNNLSAGDYIVTTIRNGVRHTFLTQRGFQLANSE